MVLHPPFIITSRLMPGLKIEDGVISLERDGHTVDNRDRFRWHLDTGDGHWTGNDLNSGVGGCGLEDMFETLL